MITKIASAPKNRVYVTDPRDWAYKIGTDYLWNPTTNTALITSGTAGQVLSEFGWVTTALGFQSGSGADFLSPADVGSPACLALDASGDIIRSPFIFGTYDHAKAVSRLLGFMPTKLTLEVRAAFTTNSADENQTAFGFLCGGGTASVQADHVAAIYCGGGNVFALDSDSAADNGSAKDQNWHDWKIVLSGSTVEWFIDGVSQGTIALKTDDFPVCFFAHTLTTNRLQIGPIHIYYS